jgi:hypothetical protein
VQVLAFGTAVLALWTGYMRIVRGKKRQILKSCSVKARANSLAETGRQRARAYYFVNSWSVDPGRN